MDDIEKISSVISLDFTPAECIANSVDLENLFAVGNGDSDNTAGCIPAMSEE